MNQPLLIHKKILQWRWYKDCAVNKLFLHALLTAEVDKVYQDGKYINRGELHTSLRSLQDETGLSLNQIRSSIKKLCSTGEIEVRTSQKFTMIKILNFDHYQQIKPNANINPVFQGSNESFLKECTNDQLYLEAIAMKKGISIDIAKDFLIKFKAHLDVADDKKTSKRQFTSHFGNWLNHQSMEYAQKNVQKTHIYTWRGVPEQKGTKSDYERDKRNYDHPGFDFKLLKII